MPGALAGIGVVALPYLIEDLTNKNEWVRYNAVVYLADAIGHNIPSDEAKTALPLLIGFLRGTNSWASSSAATALQRIDPEAAAKAGAQ